FSDIAAQQVVYGLRGVVNEGTGRALAARFGKDRLAGKSGTTNDYRDSWFVAFDARQVVTVWVGRDDNKPVLLTGSSGALPVVGEVFAQTGILPLTIQLPEALTMQNYHRDLGVLIPLDCAEGRLLPGLTRAVPERQTCAGTVREEKWWERWF
ncbi:penicillin-binding protein 1B, partial [Pseudidiomarina aestuarii]